MGSFLNWTLNISLIFFFYAGQSVSFGDTASSFNEKLSLYSIVTEIPKTSEATLQESFTKATIGPWAGILLSTAITFQYDQEILDNVQYFGRKSGVGNQDNTKTVWRVGPYPILRLPTDTGSLLYFFGDGWIHMGTAAGLLAGGHFGANTRAWNTGIQLVHGMTVSTFFSQAFKRATGRESPTELTEDRGAWRPFPSIKAYNEHTARYDAFPSGHIMTATLTFTVLGENYPEYIDWIVPIEIGWLTLLGLQMINNGVHWASDYPLGIAMGYQIGKISARIGKEKRSDNPSQNGDRSFWNDCFFYSGVFEGAPTINVLATF